MAEYGVKYKIEWATRLGNLHKIEVAEMGYTGYVYNRSLANAHARLIKDGGEGIQGRSLEFSVKSTIDYEFISLTMANYRRYKVTYTRNDLPLFIGFLVQNQHTEPYKSAPYPVTLTALDGIGLLKNIDYTPNGVQSVFSTINQCIQKTENTLDYWVITTLKEDAQTGNDNWLHVEINTDFFEDAKCYDVIEKLLETFGANIEQTFGVWCIYHFTDMHQPIDVYNSNLVYQQTLPAGDVFAAIALEEDSINLETDVIIL